MTGSVANIASKVFDQELESLSIESVQKETIHPRKSVYQLETRAVRVLY